MRKRKKEYLTMTFIMGLVIIALGVKALFWVVTDFPKGYSSTKWPTTTGIVLDSSLRKSYSRGVGFQYSPQIRYQYSINNMQYIGDHVSYPPRRSSKTWAESIIKKYNLGSKATVHYNPQNPSISCLESGADYFFLILMGLFSMIFLGMGSFVCYYSFKPIKRRKS